MVIRAQPLLQARVGRGRRWARHHQDAQGPREIPLHQQANRARHARRGQLLRRAMLRARRRCRLHGHQLGQHRRSHHEPVFAARLRRVHGRRKPPVLDDRHAPQRPLPAWHELRAVRGWPVRHRRAKPGRTRHLGGSCTFRPPAMGHETLPAHAFLVFAQLCLAARPEGYREGL